MDVSFSGSCSQSLGIIPIEKSLCRDWSRALVLANKRYFCKSSNWPLCIWIKEFSFIYKYSALSTITSDWPSLKFGRAKCALNKRFYKLSEVCNGSFCFSQMLMNAHQIPALMEIVLTHLDPITVNVTLDSRGLLPSKHALVRQCFCTQENVPRNTMSKAVGVKGNVLKWDTNDESVKLL